MARPLRTALTPLLFAACATVAAAQSVSPPQVIRLEAAGPEGARIVAVLEMNTQAGLSCLESWGCDEFTAPASRLEKATVTMAGDPVYLSRSAIGDLTSIRTARLEVAETGVTLVMSGGDAATSYEARLVFADGFLRKRRVEHGEFRHESWEETTYSSALMYPEPEQ